MFFKIKKKLALKKRSIIGFKVHLKNKIAKKAIPAKPRLSSFEITKLMLRSKIKAGECLTYVFLPLKIIF